MVGAACEITQHTALEFGARDEDDSDTACMAPFVKLNEDEEEMNEAVIDKDKLATTY